MSTVVSRSISPVSLERKDQRPGGERKKSGSGRDTGALYAASASASVSVRAKSRHRRAWGGLKPHGSWTGVGVSAILPRDDGHDQDSWSDPAATTTAAVVAPNLIGSDMEDFVDPEEDEEKLRAEEQNAKILLFGRHLGGGGGGGIGGGGGTGSGVGSLRGKSLIKRLAFASKRSRRSNSKSSRSGGDRGRVDGNGGGKG